MTEVSTKVIRLRLKVSINAAVAQRIRASVYGTEGRGFESLQPHQAFRGYALRSWYTSR